ncbi:hypothetical protein CVT24_010150 [Panaeolus cyanescens]|uniref:Nucleoplasmin-like domain-containing protein n=1 Tax=Panaeolus cyanescens TaxID=181874 RepID=A0A409WM69_9AGAR|nr:hypothetical protein CVT24_010150 [Panaeolus cyanescens]
MSFEVQSYGSWSTVVERSTSVLVRPGAPLQLQSISISFALQVPKNSKKGVLRSVLILTSRVRGAPIEASRAVITSLVPEKTENFDCNIRLFPHKEYTFEVHGNDVHIFGEFIGIGPAQDFPKTEIRKILRAPHREHIGQSSFIRPVYSTSVAAEEDSTVANSSDGARKRRKEWKAGTV